MRSDAHPIDDLSAFLDGELVPAERERVEAHLATCERCREELAELSQTVGLLRRLPAVAAPRSFAIDPASVAPPPPIRLYSPRYYALRQATGALAALFVCVLALTLVLGPAAQLAPAGAGQPATAAKSTGAARAGVTTAQGGEAVRASAPGAADTASNAAAPAAVAARQTAATSAAPASALRGAPVPAATPAAAAGSGSGAPSAPAPPAAPAPAATSVPAAASAAGSALAPRPAATSAARTLPVDATSPPGQSGEPIGPPPRVAASTPVASAAQPFAPPGPPALLVYLAWGLGIGLVAVAGTWVGVWLRERR